MLFDNVQAFPHNLKCESILKKIHGDEIDKIDVHRSHTQHIRGCSAGTSQHRKMEQREAQLSWGSDLYYLARISNRSKLV